LPDQKNSDRREGGFALDSRDPRIFQENRRTVGWTLTNDLRTMRACPKTGWQRSAMEQTSPARRPGSILWNGITGFATDSWIVRGKYIA